VRLPEEALPVDPISRHVRIITPAQCCPCLSDDGRGENRLQARSGFDIRASTITGTAVVPVKEGQELRLYKGNLRLTYVTLDKERVAVPEHGETVRILSPHDGTVEIGYEGIFRAKSHPDAKGSGDPDSVIGEKGIYLTGTWYPKPDQMFRYHLTATLPEDMRPYPRQSGLIEFK